MAEFRSSRLLRLNSRDLASNVKNKYAATFQMKETQLQDTKSVLLKSAKIPNTQFNVNPSTNTWVFPNTLNATSDYVVPIGQYDVSALIPVLESLVAGLTIVQDPITQFLTLTMSGGTFDVVADASSNPFGYYLLGSRSAATAVNPWTMTAFPDLSGLQTVFIESNALAPFGCMCGADKVMRSVFCGVPISVPFGQIHTHEEDSTDTQDFSHFQSRNLNVIDIALIDATTMKPIDLNGLDYEIVFRVYS